MKYICFFIAMIGTCVALPPPYDSLREVLPFVDHGWYENGEQLHALIKQRNVKTIVEVGSWLGRSTIDLAKTLPEDGKVYAVDHWLGSSEHQPGSSAWHPSLSCLYEQFLSNIIHQGLTDKVVPLRMDSLSAASVLEIEPDLVYIDADHTTEAVYRDLCAWYPIVKGKGILCGDDWWWPTVRRAVHHFAAENSLGVKASGNFWVLIEKKPRAVHRRSHH